VVPLSTFAAQAAAVLRESKIRHRHENELASGPDATFGERSKVIDPASVSFCAPAQKAHFSAQKAYFRAVFFFPGDKTSCTLRYS
jgi:hypothetical protein